MKKQNEKENFSDKRLLDAIEICKYTGLGRCTARELMDEIGATRKFGRRVLFDKKVIDEYLDSLM